MKIKELLSDRSKWIKRYIAKDKNGNPCNHDEGVKWCLIGAMYKCYPNNASEIFEKVYREIKGGSVADWNNSPKTKFKDVKALINKLDI